MANWQGDNKWNPWLQCITEIKTHCHLRWNQAWVLDLQVIRLTFLHMSVLSLLVKLTLSMLTLHDRKCIPKLCKCLKGICMSLEPFILSMHKMVLRTHTWAIHYEAQRAFWIKLAGVLLVAVLTYIPSRVSFVYSPPPEKKSYSGYKMTN